MAVSNLLLVRFLLSALATKLEVWQLTRLALVRLLCVGLVVGWWLGTFVAAACGCGSDPTAGGLLHRLAIVVVVRRRVD